MGFTEDRSIDKFSLDIEWTRQPEYVDIYGKKHAVAVFKRDAIKEQLDEIKDDYFIDIKANFKEYGLDKAPTDSMTKSMVNIQEDVIDLKKELRRASLKVNTYASACKALDHKKTGLEYLTKLVFTGYWSDPKITTEIKDRYQDSVNDKYNESFHDSKMEKRKKRKTQWYEEDIPF